jgi:predicted PurR-regulated permease PerM
MSVTKQTLFRLIIEVLIYAALVAVYLALVLHFLMNWLQELFTKQPVAYAFVAILLMIVQSVGLERLVSTLVHVTRLRREP